MALLVKHLFLLNSQVRYISCFLLIFSIILFSHLHITPFLYIGELTDTLLLKSRGSNLFLKYEVGDYSSSLSNGFVIDYEAVTNQGLYNKRKNNSIPWMSPAGTIIKVMQMHPRVFLRPVTGWGTQILTHSNSCVFPNFPVFLSLKFLCVLNYNCEYLYSLHYEHAPHG